ITGSTAIPPRRTIRNDRLPGDDRRGISRLPRDGRPADAVRGAGARRDLQPTLFPAPDRASGALYRLLLAAGGGSHRAVHRHGAGFAILYRLQPVQRPERGRDGGGAVDDPRIGAGHRLVDGGRTGRRRGSRPGDDACRRLLLDPDPDLQLCADPGVFLVMSAGQTPKIALAGVEKSFGRKRVLDGIELAVAAGESLVIIGGSGTGKSVLIKCILGLMRPEAG